MNFCDFCTCDQCKFGEKNLYHAKTTSGKWICDICFSYDVCTSGPNRNPNGPCESDTCKHRPRLISGWKEFNEVSKVSKRK